MFKLSTRKRNNEKEQWSFVFPVSTITIVLRTRQMTTGCEFNQVVPLNKGTLVVVGFSPPVALLTCLPVLKWTVHCDLTKLPSHFSTKDVDLGNKRKGYF